MGRDLASVTRLRMLYPYVSCNGTYCTTPPYLPHARIGCLDDISNVERCDYVVQGCRRTRLPCGYHGRTAAAPVFVGSSFNSGSSATFSFGTHLGVFGATSFGFGTSMMGRPAAARSRFHRSQDEPPAVSISSVNIADDHLPSRSNVLVVPSSIKRVNSSM